jgi:hypothetical protein
MEISSDTLFLCDSIGGFAAVNVNTLDTLFSTNIISDDISVRNDTAYIVSNGNVFVYDISNNVVLGSLGFTEAKGVYAGDSGIVVVVGSYDLYIYLVKNKSLVDTVVIKGLFKNITGNRNNAILSTDYGGEIYITVSEDSLSVSGIDRYAGIKSIAYNEYNNLLYAAEGMNNGIFVFSFDDSGKIDLRKRIDYGGNPCFIQIVDDTFLFVAAAWKGLQILKTEGDSLLFVSSQATRSAQSLDKRGNY